MKYLGIFLLTIMLMVCIYKLSAGDKTVVNQTPKENKLNIKKDTNLYKPIIHKYKYVTTYKVIKDLKEIQSTNTTYEYKYNIWKGSFYHQPNIHSITEYYIIYTNGVSEKVNLQQYIQYSKGDTIKQVNKVLIN